LISYLAYAIIWLKLIHYVNIIMFIQTQGTPNPETLKFIPGVQVLDINKFGTMSFSEGDDLRRSPLAETLFKVNGVKGIFLADDFITITKAPDQNWETLKPLLLAEIMDHFVAGFPVVSEAAAKNPSADAVLEDEVAQKIRELIDERVRPAVAQDGGDILFKDFRDGVVYLELHGACSGCPSSTITLKQGIENMLKHYVPEVQSVEQV
jgi:Fe-S cluster biogenesis protein NfuA